MGDEVRGVPTLRDGGYLVPNQYMVDVFAMLSVSARVRPRMRLSRWERILIYFGLMRDPRPYVHTFTPAIPIVGVGLVGPPMTITELWGDWEWVE